MQGAAPGAAPAPGEVAAGLAPGSMWDDYVPGHPQTTALAILEQTDHPSLTDARWATEKIKEQARRDWERLRTTLDLNEWSPILASLGADEGNILAMALLAQQGVSGRTEANKLLWTWLQPKPLGGAAPGHSYSAAPLIFQSQIRTKRQYVDSPPTSWRPQQHPWEPGWALGPWWVLKSEFKPQAPPAPGPCFGAAPVAAVAAPCSPCCSYGNTCCCPWWVA